MSCLVTALHHVQLAMPPGAEAAARDFYGELLGLREVEKPDALKDRGGVWFETGALRVHLGVEVPFQPARKAHPAFAVKSLESVATQLRGQGISVSSTEPLPGLLRAYADDPFRNRIEFVETIALGDLVE